MREWPQRLYGHEEPAMPLTVDAVYENGVLKPA
jgi:hypothetical protein